MEVFSFVEFLAMLTDFGSGFFGQRSVSPQLMIGCEVSIYQITVLGMRMIEIVLLLYKGNVSGDVGIRSCGGGPKIQQRGRKSKAPSKVFIFQKWGTF